MLVEVPLGETTEAYDLEILNGVTVVRTVSGLSFQFGGLPLCLATAGLMALASWLAARRLNSA